MARIALQCQQSRSESLPACRGHGAGSFLRSGQKEALVSFGSLVALLVLLAAFVLYLMARMDGVVAAMFGGLALAVLLSPWPIRWTPPA